MAEHPLTVNGAMQQVVGHGMDNAKWLAGLSLAGNNHSYDLIVHRACLLGHRHKGKSLTVSQTD
ncbi:MAG: hypothetical protein U0995_03330 [Erythrobacter sp.]|nr:hypothetical protein [Erythrobacter sp.]